MSRQLWVGEPTENLWHRWEQTYIWTVPGNDPFSKPSVPKAGESCFVWATVTNRSEIDVREARVEFYSTPMAFYRQRAHATHIGTSFVDIPKGAKESVVCLNPWIPQFANDAYECIAVELHHYADPLPKPGPEFFYTLEYTQVGERNFFPVKLPGTMGKLSAYGVDVPPIPFDARVRFAITTVEEPLKFEDQLVAQMQLSGYKRAADIAEIGLARTPSGDNGKWSKTQELRISNSGERIYVIFSPTKKWATKTYQVVRGSVYKEQDEVSGLTFALTASE